MTPLPLDAPVAALLTAGGVPVAELARRLGVTRGAVHSARRACGGVRLETLARIAEAAGGRVEVVFVTDEEGQNVKRPTR